ncbi:MAG: TIGR02302 family protein [Alphaproteobacteria bacterium]|nr:TIGR02302 family protein [Alphaproteobacteria bacterium]
MENRPTPSNDVIGGVIARRLRLAQAALTWERLWPALWPAVGIAGLFLAAALFDLFVLVPVWVHTLALLAFGVAFGAAAWRGLRTFQIPDLDNARRRLELKSGFSHRPLAALSDSVTATSDPTTLALWRVHQERARAMVRRLHVGLPEAGLARHDPRGLRAALAVVLVLGFAYAGSSWDSRLWDAFGPRAATRALDDSAKAELTAWIAAPNYTAMAPIFLAQPATAPINGVQPRGTGAVRVATGAILRVPVGSTFFARVHGGEGAPEATLDGAATAFDAVDTQNFQINLPLNTGRALSVAQGRASLGRWQIEIIPDLAPTIAFIKPVGVTQRMATQVDYAATDDYGVQSGQMKMRREGVAGDTAAFDLALPGILPKKATGTRFYDLTPHPWAGLAVVMWLEAVDSIGQVGKSDEVTFILPERQFRNPVARAVVEQRRNLAADPENRDDVAFALDALTEALAPEIDDFGTYLDLRASIGQLNFDRRAEAVPEVIDRLWDTALRLEEGKLGTAERELRQAQQALQDALSRNAPDGEIEQLMAELQEAMDRYLQEMQQQAAQQQDQQAREMTRQDLQQMLEQAREMARDGAREQAQAMLQQLQRTLENLRNGQQQQQQSPGQRQAEQAMRQLGEIIQRQQQLMDQTFQQAQRGQFGEPGQLPPPADQEALRQQLGEMMRGLGDQMGQIPQAFGEAERAMRGATQALEGQNAGEALNQQGQALDRLRETAQQMMQGFAANSQQPGQGQGQQGQNGLRPGQTPNPNVDPLGRPIPGMGADISNRTEVPDKADLQKAREILEELFRRAGERFRSSDELEYLNRLLRRF